MHVACIFAGTRCVVKSRIHIKHTQAKHGCASSFNSSDVLLLRNGK